MKIFYSLFARGVHVYATVIFTCISLQVYAQSSKSFCEKAQMLIEDFNKYHVAPIDINSSTSQEVIELFIKAVDPDAIFLKAPDRDVLQLNNDKLFSQIYSNQNEYVFSALKIYKNAIRSTDSLYDAVLSKSFDFKEKDSLVFNPSDDSIFYSPDISYHAKRIRRYVKTLCMYKAHVLYSDTLSESDFYLKVDKLRGSVVKRLKANLNKQLNNADKFIETTLLNSIAQRYDPHSNFFTYEQTKKFNSSLSAHVETFGLLLGDSKGEIEVAYISPGSSAWICNEINVGDIFISMRINNMNYTSDEHDVNELMSIIESGTNKTMELQIKKKNGEKKNIQLVKRKIQSDENYVKGYVLKANNLRIGYIDLPSFYVETEDSSLPGCANDVAKEILKLENDSIKGLILDLRNNGGGSMREAMDLAGIFINEGPLFIYKPRNQKPYLMKDLNRGIAFKKPILVLINEYSASASELFCNILQDYNIGIIAGQNSYGKATAQMILPLDSNLLMSKKNNDNIDCIKVTDSRLYRLNNSTHQGNGVVPDITLPSLSGNTKKEKDYPYFLKPDSIKKKVLYTPLVPLPKELLAKKSLARQSISSDIKNAILFADSLKNVYNSKYKIALTHNSYLQYIKQLEKLIERSDIAFDAKNNSIKAFNNSFDNNMYRLDPLLNNLNNEVLKSIDTDIFINEAFLILNDLILTLNQ